MLKPINCDGCGATIQLDDNKTTIVCAYCNTTYTNPNKKMGQGFNNAWGHTAWDRANAAAGFNANNPQNRPMGTPPPRPKMSGCLIAFLVVAFWPGAIIYGVYTHHQQEEWDRKWGGLNR
ncbi:MAG: hypothetical protein FWE03_03100 [Firmicutes bacterium]|nr:hypothetical protein [Bacillota bacterium]